VFPNPRALAVTQDRLVEKNLFRSLGIPVGEYAAVSTRDELDAQVARIGGRCILKTRRLGYDGKGQFRIKSPADIDAAWQALGAQAQSVGLIVEAFIPFQRELSVVAVRGRDGEFRTWPLTENWHVDGVLSASLAPATVDAGLAAQAFAHARKLAEALDYVGVFALELFCTDGELLANEIAPRVHNSGHWTIEGAECSQFENHLRAIAGLPLGSTAKIGESAMVNFIGSIPPSEKLLAIDGCHLHHYSKAFKPGRKVGHATLRCADSDALQKKIAEVEALL